MLYKQGETISFRIKREKRKITEQIRGFSDSTINFQFYAINPTEITHLYVDSKTKTWFILRYKYERIFLYSGVVYLLLDVVNTGELTNETLIIGSSLIGAGLLAKFIIPKTIKIRGRRMLRILH